MDVINKTKGPIQIPLPGGKKLRLGPGRAGQISPKAASHPAVVKLVEAGDIELVGDGRTQTKGSGAGGSIHSSQRGSSGGGMRHTGDR